MKTMKREGRNGIGSAIDQTWAVIAGDVYDAAAQVGEEIDLEGAADGVLDYVTTYGDLSPDAAAEWEAATYDQKVRAARKILAPYFI